jgi:hypothetical protein
LDALFAASKGVQPTVLTEIEVAGLPEPVQRWLRYARVVGTERPATVRLKMEGEFRQAAGRGWMPFEAEEYYTTDPPGFVWTTRMQLAPLLSVVGRDRYAGGEGSIDMRLLALIPVARASGAKLDQGALLRYLNETMWFPAAAVSPYITWDGIDATSARATMSYGGVTAPATFVFDEQGRLNDMVAERYELTSGRLETWSTPIRAYGEFAGIRVPVEGEGIWKYHAGDFSYIRLRITQIEYNRPERF